MDPMSISTQFIIKTRFHRLSLLAILSAALIFAFTGCGIAYQAGTRLKATRMSDSLQVGQTSPQVHHSWGEPDIRTYLPGETEVWSYPFKPNSNDVAAALMYTSSKDGDKGTFLDLKFVQGKLVSWQEAEHTLPAKGHTGIGLGVGGGPIGNGTQTTPGAVHY
jgi:outer membrane protein assembly factor BamE (lipoprotein component of BamABCDE complex)